MRREAYENLEVLVELVGINHGEERRVGQIAELDTKVEAGGDEELIATVPERHVFAVDYKLCLQNLFLRGLFESLLDHDLIVAYRNLSKVNLYVSVEVWPVLNQQVGLSDSDYHLHGVSLLLHIDRFDLLCAHQVDG